MFPYPSGAGLHVGHPLGNDYNQDICNDLATGVAAPGGVFSDQFTADYEGEIIYASVLNQSRGIADQVGEGPQAYLSVVGNEVQVYNGKMDWTGKVSFYTRNIYGKREVVTELYPRPRAAHYLVLDNAFVEPKPNGLPELALSSDMEEALLRRSINMQIEWRFLADTLHRRSEPLPNPAFQKFVKAYLLDNYTRFPTMDEVVTEFIPEARFRQSGGKPVLQVRYRDAFGHIAGFPDASLVLLDGIPIFGHEQIYNYDPKLIKSVTLYEGPYFIGSVFYSGIASFSSYTGLYPALKFDEDARITSFTGVQYPMEFMAPRYNEPDSKVRYEMRPDCRHTLYWNANLNTVPGEKEKVFCSSSEYTGDFIVVVEGMSADGKGFRQECRFSVGP